MPGIVEGMMKVYARDCMSKVRLCEPPGLV
jgi:hypothetical protein